ncbi:MAG: hypothetical protein ACYC40_00885 [Patescibacteria group bacterium]
MQNLLTWQFWFNLRPDPLIPIVQKSLIALFLILVILTVVTAIFKKRSSIYRGLLKRLYNFYLSNSIIALLFIFLNYEMIPFFSARFWLGLWILMMIFWLFFILKNLKKINTGKKELEQAQELKKYLP